MVCLRRTDANQTLASIVDFLRANPGAKAVISGYHDPAGNAAHNYELAKDRAMNVRDTLAATGISTDRIILQKPVETTGSGDPAEARRVEVSVQ